MSEPPLVTGNPFFTQEQHSNGDSPVQDHHSSESRPEETYNDGLLGEPGSTFSLDDIGQINQDGQHWMQNNPDSGLSPSMLEPMDFQSSATPTFEMDSGFASGSALGSCSPYPLNRNEGLKAPIESGSSDGSEYILPYAVKQIPTSCEAESPVADQTGAKEGHDTIDTCLGTVSTWITMASENEY